MNLRNATALITGGSSGIGRAIAQTLASSGARVAITGRDRGRLTETALALKALPIVADVANEADVERTYQELFKAFGELDILVNNAGVAPAVRTDLLEASEESFYRVIATNLKGPYFLTQRVAKFWVSRARE